MCGDRMCELAVDSQVKLDRRPDNGHVRVVAARVISDVVLSSESSDVDHDVTQFQLNLTGSVQQTNIFEAQG